MKQKIDQFFQNSGYQIPYIIEPSEIKVDVMIEKISKRESYLNQAFVIKDSIFKITKRVINYEEVINIFKQNNIQLSECEYLLLNIGENYTIFDEDSFLTQQQLAKENNKVYFKIVEGVKQQGILESLNHNSLDQNKYQNFGGKFQLQSQQKKRIRERQIKDVIDLVDKWKCIHRINNSQQKNCSRQYTLNDSANSLGMCRKSLDNYNILIKQAQNNNFDFSKYSNNGMGFLRKFLQNIKNKNNIIIEENSSFSQLIEETFIDKEQDFLF